MARFITVHVQCDWAACEEVGVEGDGRILPKTVALDGKQAREFLVCKQHLADFEAIVLPLMQAGIKVEPAPSPAAGKKRSAQTSVADGETVEGRNAEGKIDCQAEGCDRQGRHGLTNRTGMAQHVIRTHAYEGLAAYEAEFGPVV